MSDFVLEAWQGATPVRLGVCRQGRVVAALAAGALLVAAIGLVIGLRTNPAPPAPVAPSAAPAAPAWREILKPVRIYSLQAAAFAGAPATYSARVHAPDGGREDLLTFGRFDDDRPALRLRVFRAAAETPAVVPMGDAIRDEAATLGLDLLSMGRPEAVPTRLGRFQAADVGLRRASGAERTCAGFRLVLDRPALSITGLACGRQSGPHRASAMSPTDTGCLLERLDVASARDDRELIDYYAASELQRNSACAGMRLGPDGLHAPWLDEKPSPTRSEIASGKPATPRRSLRRH